MGEAEVQPESPMRLVKFGLTAGEVQSRSKEKQNLKRQVSQEEAGKLLLIGHTRQEKPGFTES